jgi:hypothetical protein
MSTHSSLRRESRAIVAGLITLTLLISLADVSLFAQVRRTTAYSTFVNPARTSVVTRTFSRGGIFMIAGGVALHGKAQFIVETPTSKQTVAAASVRLGVGERGTVYLAHGNNRYTLTMHQGLACPLGQFVSRGGEIAYTVPEDKSPIHLRQQGLVESAGAWVAREFAKTEFESLLDFTDLWTDDEPLPDDLAKRLMNDVNGRLSSRPRQANEVASYINSDSQVTYRVFLMQDKGRAEVAGVPLRYYWQQATDQSAIVFQITALAQNWTGQPRLTDFKAAAAEPTQYDAVLFYQAAAVFSEVRSAAPADFKAFVSMACRK